MELKKYAPYLLFIVFYIIFYSACIFFTLMCQNTNFASNFSEFFIEVISVALFIILAVSSHYNAKIKEKMLLLTVVIIVLMAVSFYIYMAFRGCGGEVYDFETELDQYHIACDYLCQRYIDRDYIPAEAVHYCEKYYEIDLNENGKIGGEVGRIMAYGVSEDRVYCFTLNECIWGSSRNKRLTPEKCRDIMCDVYTERYNGNQTAASASIKNKMIFGESTHSDHEDLIVVDVNGNSILDPDGKIVSLASWWIDNFQNVDCTE